MVDSIFGNISRQAQPPGMIARLKVSAPAATPVSTGLTDAEQGLADLLDLGDDVKAQVQSRRKTDAYLRIFNTALKILNGWPWSKAPAPQAGKAEVEFVPPKTPSVKTEA